MEEKNKKETSSDDKRKKCLETSKIFVIFSLIVFALSFFSILSNHYYLNYEGDDQKFYFFQWILNIFYPSINILISVAGIYLCFKKDKFKPDRLRLVALLIFEAYCLGIVVLNVSYAVYYFKTNALRNFTISHIFDIVLGAIGALSSFCSILFKKEKEKKIGGCIAPICCLIYLGISFQSLQTTFDFIMFGVMTLFFLISSFYFLTYDGSRFIEVSSKDETSKSKTKDLKVK